MFKISLLLIAFLFSSTLAKADVVNASEGLSLEQQKVVENNAIIDGFCGMLKINSAEKAGAAFETPYKNHLMFIRKNEYIMPWMREYIDTNSYKYTYKKLDNGLYQVYYEGERMDEFKIYSTLIDNETFIFEHEDVSYIISYKNSPKGYGCDFFK